METSGNMFTKWRIKYVRRRVFVSILILISVIFIWSELFFDLAFEESDFLWYKYRANRTGYACVKWSGGLGNLLFQYTFLYTMAQRHNLTLVCPEWRIRQLQSLFHVPDCVDDLLGLRVCQSHQMTALSKDTGYDKGVENLKFQKDLSLLGFFQSWKYWGKNEATFREFFSIKQGYKDSARLLVDTELRRIGYSRSNVTLVGVHIRRGDMLKKFYYNFGYNVVSKEYVLKSKQYIRDRVQGDIVYVFASNDMTWTKDALPETNAIYLNGNTRNLDFAVLSSCDHLITSVGTFGWWIGWHVKGIVTFYKKPFRPNTGLEAVFADDYLESFFYPNWVGFS